MSGLLKERTEMCFTYSPGLGEFFFNLFSAKEYSNLKFAKLYYCCGLNQQEALIIGQSDGISFFLSAHLKNS